MHDGRWQDTGLGGGVGGVEYRTMMDATKPYLAVWCAHLHAHHSSFHPNTGTNQGLKARSAPGRVLKEGRAILAAVVSF